MNTPGFADHFDSPTQEALRQLEQLGAEVRLEPTQPDRGEAGLVVEVTRSTQTPDAVLAELQKMRPRFRLVLRGSRATDAGVRRLAACEPLWALEIHREPRLTPLCLEYLPRTLRELVLSGGQIDDRWLDRVGKHRQLVRLDLSNTRISDQGLRFLAGLSRLEILELRNTDTRDRGLKCLSRLNKLRHLSLEGTYCTAAGAAAVRGKLGRPVDIPPW